jgi:hypothetical protein
MTTDKKEDLINPIEINVENNPTEDGLNNNDPDAILKGGDNEEGLPSVQEKKTYKKEDDDELDNEEIESPKPEIESPEPKIESPEPDIKNPDTETIIKKIEGEEHGGDKVDIVFPNKKTIDTNSTQPKDEYLEN